MIDEDTLRTYVKSDTSYDSALYADAIAGAVEFLRTATGRYIAAADEVATPRSYRPDTTLSSVLRIHDCAEITSVVEQGATLTAHVDYLAEPLNGITPAGESRPYDRLLRLGMRAWYWDEERPTVTVTARWGWPAIPQMAKNACVIAAKAYLDNRDLSFGIVGAADFGGITEREAKIVRDFITQYRGPQSWGIA
jgi:hypothetical protein